MSGWSYPQGDEEYRRWLEALAKRMEAAPPSRPPSEPNPAGSAGLLGWTPDDPQPAGNDVLRRSEEPLGSPPGSVPGADRSPEGFSSPRIWDLWKPYVMLVGVVLAVGMVAIGTLKWLAQWCIPPSRPSLPSAPIDARWEVRRRGLHILPDSSLAPQQADPAADPSGTKQRGSEKSLSPGPGSESAFSEEP